MAGRVMEIATPATYTHPQAAPRAAQPGEQNDGWRPMETAPKDGTVVDLWFAKSLRPHRKAGFYWCSDNRAWAEDGYQIAPWRDRPCIGGNATHWRLPPAPPTAAPSEDTKDRLDHRRLG